LKIDVRNNVTFFMHARKFLKIHTNIETVIVDSKVKRVMLERNTIERS